MKAVDFQKMVERVSGVTLDELSIYHGEVACAYGHNDTMMFTWSSRGEAGTAKRNSDGHFFDIHDELFSAYYERNETYDLGRDNYPVTTKKEHNEPRQLSLW